MTTPESAGTQASRRRRFVRVTLICLGVLVLTALAASHALA